MRHIIVLNSKGGCGKSTIATNLAAYYATQDKKVAIVDYDPQASSLDWVDRRPASRPAVIAVNGAAEGMKHLPRNSEVVIVDAPARVQGKELTDLVRHSDTIIVPILPSSIDIQAAGRFITELKQVGKVERKQAKVAVIANRVRMNTLIFDELDEYLDKLRVPYVAAFREAQNYIRAYTRGLGVCELPEYLAWPDWEEWEPLLKWLKSKRSQP